MQDELTGSTSFTVSVALFEGGLAVLAACLGWAFHRPPLTTFTLNFSGIGWGLLATVPMFSLFWLCLKLPWRPFAKVRQVLDDTFIPLFSQCGLLELAIISLLAGLGEEMLFRGIMQDWFAEKIGGFDGMVFGLVASAVIFGLLHSLTTTYALLAGFIGLFLGVIWLLTGNILVPITCHAVYDLVAMVYLLHDRQKILPETNDS